MLHTIRQVVNNDSTWRRVLQGLQATNRHQTVSSKQVEDYINRETGIDFSPVFTQYLRTTRIPTFEYHVDGTTLSYRWNNVVPGFAMPVRVTVSDTGFTFITPREAWQTLALHLQSPQRFRVDSNFYVFTTDVTKAASGAR
jgi:aminopeptidase N